MALCGKECQTTVLDDFAALCATRNPSAQNAYLPPKKRGLKSARLKSSAPHNVLQECVRRILTDDPESLPVLCRVAFDHKKSVNARVELLRTLWLRHEVMRQASQRKA